MCIRDRDQAVVQMNLNAKNYNLAAEPMSNVYGALYSTPVSYTHLVRR